MDAWNGKKNASKNVKHVILTKCLTCDVKHALCDLYWIKQAKPPVWSLNSQNPACFTDDCHFFSSADAKCNCAQFIEGIICLAGGSHMKSLPYSPIWECIQTLNCMFVAYCFTGGLVFPLGLWLLLIWHS